MNKNPELVPRKTTLIPGYLPALIALLVLMIAALSYLPFAPSNQHSADVSQPTDATVVDRQGRDASVNEQKTFHATDHRHEDATATSPVTRPDQPRAWRADTSGGEPLRPGYTMAELCLTELDKADFRCTTAQHGSRSAQSVSAPGTGPSHTISGRVVTTDGVGLGGVRIVASPERINESHAPTAGVLRFWTATDSTGAYSLDGLPDGEYTIRSTTHGQYRSARTTARAGVDYADLLVYRDAATVIEGRVLDGSGQALEGVTVLPNLLGQASVLTDRNGRFHLPVRLQSPLDSLALRFQRAGYLEQTERLSLHEHNVVDGSTVTVVMHHVDTWTSVAGTVHGDSGEPLVGRTVELKPLSAQRTYATATDHKGHYSFDFVESPADYRLTVLGGDGYKDHQQLVRVTPDIGELNVVAESYEFGEVTGQLVNPAGMPVPDFDLLLRNTASRKPNVLITTDEYGNFEIPMAPAGEIVIASQSTPSILVQGARLSPGTRLHLPITLDWGGHEIRGLVVGADGNPVPASRVVLQWSHQADGITTRATRRTTADMHGHFGFSNLGPGPHSLRIDAQGYRSVNVDHDLSRQGYNVTVKLN